MAGRRLPRPAPARDRPRLRGASGAFAAQRPTSRLAPLRPETTWPGSTGRRRRRASAAHDTDEFIVRELLVDEARTSPRRRPRVSMAIGASTHAASRQAGGGPRSRSIASTARAAECSFYPASTQAEAETYWRPPRASAAPGTPEERPFRGAGRDHLARARAHRAAQARAADPELQVSVFSDFLVPPTRSKLRARAAWSVPAGDPDPTGSAVVPSTSVR